jgi:hypothetical protein
VQLKTFTAEKLIAIDLKYRIGLCVTSAPNASSWAWQHQRGVEEVPLGGHRIALSAARSSSSVSSLGQIPRKALTPEFSS